MKLIVRNGLAEIKDGEKVILRLKTQGPIEVELSDDNVFSQVDVKQDLGVVTGTVVGLSVGKLG